MTAHMTSMTSSPMHRPCRRSQCFFCKVAVMRWGMRSDAQLDMRLLCLGEWGDGFGKAKGAQARVAGSLAARFLAALWPRDEALGG
ncbi:hypothetical protein GCM10027276_08290 [Comamonas piscis]